MWRAFARAMTKSEWSRELEERLFAIRASVLSFLQPRRHSRFARKSPAMHWSRSLITADVLLLLRLRIRSSELVAVGLCALLCSRAIQASSECDRSLARAAGCVCR